MRRGSLSPTQKPNARVKNRARKPVISSMGEVDPHRVKIKIMPGTIKNYRVDHDACYDGGIPFFGENVF